MAQNSTSRHCLKQVDASFLKCKVCGEKADYQLKLVVDGGVGGYGRKGSRSLGFYCEPHARQKVDALRAGRKRSS